MRSIYSTLNRYSDRHLTVAFAVFWAPVGKPAVAFDWRTAGGRHTEKTSYFIGTYFVRHTPRHRHLIGFFPVYKTAVASQQFPIYSKGLVHIKLPKKCIMAPHGKPAFFAVLANYPDR